MESMELNNRYFLWLCDKVNAPRYADRPEPSYNQLLVHLQFKNYRYSIPMDANREGDGENLRYRFATETGLDDRIVASLLDIYPCSVLEVLVALAVRIEESLMYDPDLGNRTGMWFWDMISNMGLSGMTDSYYDQQYVDSVLDKFLDREYEPDGSGGGAFIIKHRNEDLRNVELWCQMAWYVDEAYHPYSF